MACHEIAALRLGLMSLIGVGTEADRQHEVAELGTAADSPGPLRALTAATNLTQLLERFDAAAVELEQRVATTAVDDPSIGYLRALVVLTKHVGLELNTHVEALGQCFANLEHLHDLVHEMFPGR